VSFEPRPFRRDLLDGSDPAADFARRFLDVVEADPPPESRIWLNRGLPLEVVNAMRHAPPDLLFSSIQDNEKLDLIKTLLSDLDAPETERTVRSRLILQAYCHGALSASPTPTESPTSTCTRCSPSTASMAARRP